MEHDVPVHDCDLEEDSSVPKGGEKMVRDEPQPSSSPTATFWNSLGTIASSVQSTVSMCSVWAFKGWAMFGVNMLIMFFDVIYQCHSIMLYLPTNLR